MSEDRCVICGEIVPEGRMICPDCEAGKMSRMQRLIDGRFSTPLIFEPSLTKDACPMCKRPFKELVERKKGKWHITDAYPHNVYCSECHKTFAQTHWAVWEDGSLPRNFCPNCGVEMEKNDGKIC